MNLLTFFNEMQLWDLVLFLPGLQILRSHYTNLPTDEVWNLPKVWDWHFCTERLHLNSKMKNVKVKNREHNTFNKKGFNSNNKIKNNVLMHDNKPWSPSKSLAKLLNEETFCLTLYLYTVRS